MAEHHVTKTLRGAGSRLVSLTTQGGAAAHKLSLDLWEDVEKPGQMLVTVSVHDLVALYDELDNARRSLAPTKKAAK